MESEEDWLLDAEPCDSSEFICDFVKLHGQEAFMKAWDKAPRNTLEARHGIKVGDDP